MSRRNRPVTKDMYWFAHGGAETQNDTNVTQKNNGEIEEETDSNFHGKNIIDRRGVFDEPKSNSSYSRDISLTDGSNSSGPPSLERDDRLHAIDKRNAVEERRKLLWEAEQERNDAVMKKHLEREAALEARRNAQRSNISFAFGSSVPRNVDTLQVNQSFESDVMSRSFTSSGSSYRAENHNYYNRRSISPFNNTEQYLLNGNCHLPDSSLSSYSEKKTNMYSCSLVGSGALIGEDSMSRSMTASISAPRGRRKNDLMPTMPYDRMAPPRVATSSSSRRRSVSMTRLDQLAQPRKHYVEATKANSTASSAASSIMKEANSPNRPLSSASEHSGGKVSSSLTRRVRSAPRKPRPVSIAGTIPDPKQMVTSKLHDVKVASTKKTHTPLKKSSETANMKKTSSSKNATPKSAEKVKSTPRLSTAPSKASSPKSTMPKPTESKTTPGTKKSDVKQVSGKASSPLSSTPKTSNNKKSPAGKKISDVMVSSVGPIEVKDKSDSDKSGSPVPDSDNVTESEKNTKRIISEEEAKAALAEKRKLAREQAEREAELERQRQEELRRLEEERLRQEEEEQKKLEEEAMRLLEEHRRQEEEKLRKAIEDQEQKEEEERSKRDEELRVKAEQERKSKEEAEKMRLELEEKLRKEEEERAERKKRLEKIMSRTRGKSSGTSPSGSVNGSDNLESGENQQEGFSSGANSLDSHDGRNSPNSEPLSSDDAIAKMEVSSGGNSIEANLTYEFSSNDVSLNSNDLMIPVSEAASENNSMVLVPDKENADTAELNSLLTPVNDSTDATSELPKDVTDATYSNTVPEISKDADENEHLQQLHVEADAETMVISAENLLQNLEQPLTTTDSIIEKDIVATSSYPLQLPPRNGSEQSTEILEEELKDTISIPGIESHSDFGAVQEEIVQQLSELDFKEPFDQSKELLSPTNTSPKNLGSPVITVEDMFLENDEASQVMKSKNDRQNLISEDIVVECHDSSENCEQNINYLEEEQKDENSLDSHVSTENEVSAVESSQLTNPFEISQNPFSDQSKSFPPQEESILQEDKLADNFFGSNFTKEQDITEQLRELGEENFLNSKPTSGADHGFTENSQFLEETQNVFQDACVLEQQIQSSESTTNVLSVDLTLSGDAPLNQLEGSLHEEQSHSTFSPHSETSQMSDAFKFKNGGGDAELLGENPFVVSKDITGESELSLHPSELGDGFPLENKFLESDQKHFEKQTVNTIEEASFQGEIDNVTLIKQEGSESYIGIISSIDNDNHFSNNISKLHEQFSNNYDCASTTDSEESSLDSNLSQVEATKNSDINNVKSLNHFENSIYATNEVHLHSNNLEYSDNPFDTENPIHPSSIPQSAVNFYSESEIYSNGHSESSMMRTDFVQLDGSDILSVDHSKNNIFENADAMDYSKASPDPFLVKGSSKQIPGNPFLMQDDQNSKVLMTSDFLN